MRRGRLLVWLRRGERIGPFKKARAHGRRSRTTACRDVPGDRAVGLRADRARGAAALELGATRRLCRRPRRHQVRQLALPRRGGERRRLGHQHISSKENGVGDRARSSGPVDDHAGSNYKFTSTRPERIESRRRPKKAARTAASRRHGASKTTPRWRSAACGAGNDSRRPAPDLTGRASLCRTTTTTPRLHCAATPSDDIDATVAYENKHFDSDQTGRAKPAVYRPRVLTATQ